MTGSEADTERKLEAEGLGDESPGSEEPEKLVRFLTPVPQARTSAPVPSRSARAALASPAVPERVGLFSDLPVPRRNSSLLPPPADAKPQDAPAATIEATTPSEFERMRPGPEVTTFSDESPTSNLLAIETAPPGDDDPDFEVHPRAPAFVMSKKTTRAIAVAGAALIGWIALMLFATRSNQSSNDARTTSTAASLDLLHRSARKANPEEPADPFANTELEPIAADPSRARDLRLEARQLLEAGQAEQGVAVARRAVAADPNDPESYVLLAAGLQDLGRWQESRDVFVKCVRESNGKANAECVYFSTRSK